MGFTLTTAPPTRAQENPPSREKTASRYFLVNTRKTHQENRHQPLKTQQEPTPYNYKIVSGRPVWPSRDPIKDSGHLLLKYLGGLRYSKSAAIDIKILSHLIAWNMLNEEVADYLGVANDLLNKIDLFGEKWLECPKGKRRCWNGKVWSDWKRGGNGCSVPPFATGILVALGADPEDDPRRGVSAGAINNEPVIGVNFNTCGACRAHDKCFVKCHPVQDVFGDFWKCHSAFKRTIRDFCKKAYDRGAISKRKYKACRRIAAAYIVAVNHGGFPLYIKSQHKYCSKCKVCPCSKTEPENEWNTIDQPLYNG